MNRGRVHLVGAGPGAADLITVRGRELLERADVVLFDRLSAPELLQHCRADAELVDVGKAPGRGVPQEETHRLILHYAEQGKEVVRLKGGDPCVFGRGWEEYLLCREAGIPCEFVPGLSSAIAVPELAEVPVTVRGLARSFAVVTGRTEEGGPPLNWEELSRLETLVILMGMGRLRQIAEAIAGHRDPQTPVAVIEQGSTPGQREVRGTLADIAARVEERGLRSPAIIVVGAVAALGQTQSHPGWEGRRVLITRPQGAAQFLARTLRQRGADVFWSPLIAIQYTDVDPAPLLADCHWLVFTSRHGVIGLFRNLEGRGLDVRALGNPRIAAVGPATEQELRRYGLRADLVPEEFRADALVRELRARLTETGNPIPSETKVGFPCGSRAIDTVRKGLAETGVETHALFVYETHPGDLDATTVQELENGIDAIVFHSPSAVDAFFGFWERRGLPAGELIGRPWFRNMTVACIGPTTASRLQSHGARAHVVPEIHTDEGLVDALERSFALEVS